MLFKELKNNQSHHIKCQSKHSIHTNSKQSLRSFAGYSLNIYTVESTNKIKYSGKFTLIFIELFFNWYYVT